MEANLISWKEHMNDRPLYGSFVTFASSDIAEFTASLGFDFIVIDNEHGVMEQTTICDMVRACQCLGVPVIVRCTENSYAHVQKPLDFGANGVQIPLINTVRDAKKVVELTHFAPLGKRGTAYLPRAAGYGTVSDKSAYLAKANYTKMVCIHIETKEAIRNLDDILNVDGIDVYFIGPGDLSASMELPANDPRVQETIQAAIKKITTSGKIAGTFVSNAADAIKVTSWGARYIITAVTPYITIGAKQYLKDVKNID